MDALKMFKTHQVKINGKRYSYKLVPRELTSVVLYRDGKINDDFHFMLLNMPIKNEYSDKELRVIKNTIVAKVNALGEEGMNKYFEKIENKQN